MTETILLAVVLLAGFYMAWNIGANDVANAMGTSVGSGALTLRQAVYIAAVLEFAGAFFLGSHVTKTVQQGIVVPGLFEQQSHLLVYGMLAALIAAGAWLQIASYYGWPVSTTHSIVGAVIGFGAVVGGVDAIYWGNVLTIVSSWVISPLIGGLFSFLIFTLLRKKIFYSADPLAVAKRMAPLLAFLAIAPLCFITLYKEEIGQTGLYFFPLLGGGLGAIITYFLVKSVRRIEGGPESTDLGPDFLAVERVFAYLQIMSAGLMAFAHGANDVANAIGPLSAATEVLITGTIPTETAIPLWALILGGIGIVIGLATWGWRVIETIGKKITELTPTRGFSSELGAAATILVASRLGMPISTTHTLVGSVIGVGLARGMGALDLATTRDIVISWIITVPAGAVIAVVFTYLLRAIFG